VVNQGADVPDGNFDLMTADGGFGLFDSCTSSGSALPMYSGNKNVWGSVYGGVLNRTDCAKLPSYPMCGTTPADDMRSLCAWSFDNGIRIEKLQTNPVITKMCQVACPIELYSSTNLRRSDEANSGFTCKTLEKSGGVLTRMMDCGIYFSF
jgi:hypothetical protein